jgi:hypothetical protein
MTLFKKKKELEAEVEESRQEAESVKERSAKIERLRADLQNHLAENHFGPRLYVQIVRNWK